MTEDQQQEAQPERVEHEDGSVQVTAPDPTPDPEEVLSPEPQIVYNHAGGSSGGQSLYVCMGLDGCGALLQEEHQHRHTQWHKNGAV